MQWSSRTEQQLADMVNAAHVRYRVGMFQPTHRLRQAPSRPVQVVVRQQQNPVQQGPMQYEPLRPRDVLLYGSWIVAVLGFLGGALWAVS